MKETVCDNPNCEECVSWKTDNKDEEYTTKPSLPNKLHPDVIKNAKLAIIVYEKFYENISPRIDKAITEFNDLGKRTRVLVEELESMRNPYDDGAYDYPLCQRVSGLFEIEYRPTAAKKLDKQFTKILDKIDDKLGTLPQFEKRKR